MTIRRPRGWHGEVVSVEVPPLVSPFVPLRPMGLAALGCRLASNPRQPTDFGRVEDCPPAARHSNHGSD